MNRKRAARAVGWGGKSWEGEWGGGSGAGQGRWARGPPHRGTAGLGCAQRAQLERGRGSRALPPPGQQRRSSFQPGPHDLLPLEDPRLLPGGLRARGPLAGGSVTGMGGAPPRASSLREGLRGLGGGLWRVVALVLQSVQVCGV